MNRQEIIKFYENKIDDIADSDVRDELLDKLTDIENLLISLDGEIDKELENQESEIIDDMALQDEFNFSNMMPM